MRSILLLGSVCTSLYVTAGASDLVLAVYTDHVLHSTCNNNNGIIDIDVVGGTAPFTFEWADGPTTEDRSGLAPGLYSVTVTDALSAQAGLSVTIDQLPNLPVN